MIHVMILITLIAGLMLGFMLGWGAGKMRTKSLLAFLTNKMEQLRADSKIKVIRRDIAKQYADTERADELTKEMAGEATVFYEVQHSISAWCRDNNEKDPFCL
jgi:hypothetical protein